MKLRRALSLLLCTCMAGSMLAGCGEKQTGGEGVETVTFWSVNAHSKATYERMINEFNQTEGKEIGVFIDYQIKEGGSIVQNLELALANGTAPDLFTSGNISNLAPEGKLIAIEDLPGGPELIEKFKDDLVEFSHTYDGKTYTLPYGNTVQGLIYNKDMFKAAGIVDENGEAKPPVTYDEMIEVAKKLTNPDKKEYGIILPFKWSGWASSDIVSPARASIGHKGFDPKTGTWDFSVLEPVINAYYQMQQDGSVYPGGEAIENDQARALFAAGGVGMKIGFSFDVGVLNDQFPAEIDWGVAPLPVLDANKTFKQEGSVGGTYMMNADALKHLSGEQLIKILEFFVSDKFVQEAYKDCVDLPLSFETVKDVVIENPKKGWEDFAKLTSISSNWYVEPEIDKTAFDSLDVVILRDAMSGKKTAKEVLDEYQANFDKAVEAYKNDSTKKPIENYMIPELDPTR
ncbi:MAG: extracellular solute-binding protein [Ruminococcaceae bacterium]|nr:extracellular solute-binding protein [Oscillospiraceae bacterium]